MLKFDYIGIIWLVRFVLVTQRKFGYIGTKFRKFHRFKFRSWRRGFTIFKPVFSDVYLSLNKVGWLTFSSVEASRRVIRRGLKKQVFIFIKVFCFVSLTCKSANSRMGGGKGNPFVFIYPLLSGKILFELFWRAFRKSEFLDWFFRDFFCFFFGFASINFLSGKFQKYWLLSVCNKLSFCPRVGRYLY